ncbi:MAG: M16 family metallopeptidase [Myxococcota bacterium]
MSARRKGMSALAAGLAVWPLLGGCALVQGLGDPKPAWEDPPPPPREAPVVQEGALDRGSLENGLTLMVLEDHRTPMVVLGVALPRGASVVDPAEAGLATLAAEVMERGAGERDALELAVAIEDLGAQLSVSVGWDTTTVSISGLSRDADRLFELLSDVVLRPRFEESEAIKARGERMASLAQAQDEPATLVGWQALRVLYPGHRFGLPLDGTPETVSRFDAAAARRYHEKIFRPVEAVFFAAGDVASDDIIDRARDHFGSSSWPAADPVPASPPPPARAPERTRVVVVDKPDLGQARIVLAHEGIDRRHPDRVAADVMNKVFGGSGFSSRLMARVRSDEGLTYGVYSGFDLRRQPGPFRVSTFTRVEEAGRMVELLLEEMGRIREEPPTEVELAQAISLAVGRFGLGLESSEAVLAGLVNLEVYDLPPDSLDTYRTRVRAVDAEAAADTARRFIHPDRVAIVVLGPAEALVPQLERFGKVETVNP